MAIKYTRPRGTQDVLPENSWKWQAVEAAVHKILQAYGYQEMRLPTFESTEVFSRSVGEGTDIVSKEMYTFEDKGGRSVTLRPEGTAGIVRSVLENGLLASSPLPLKSYYLQSCFRYEKAQKGRLREFHQVGIECFGTHEAVADVEVIAVGAAILQGLGVMRDVTLEINSIGCPACRPRYHQDLKNYFMGYRADLCPTCLERLEKNPMRILDCKNEKCAAIAAGAPVMLDYLCEDCVAHFEEVQALLDEAGLPYRVNPTIVRGLDYYTNTVFEFIAEGVGTQGTLCAGGRYDKLVETMGGAPTPGVGFGMGLERVMMAMDEANAFPPPPPGPLLYAVGIGEEGRAAGRKLVGALRGKGLYAELDLAGRSVKAQMKAAGRLNARFTTVLGDDEAQSGQALLKELQTGEEQPVSLADLPKVLAAKAERDT